MITKSRDPEIRRQEALAREAEDAKHREACARQLGHRRCICADYAAVTGCLHPDCPEHGYVQ